MRSRYQLNESPPMLRGDVTTPSSPSTRRVARAMTSVSRSWFTTGGTPRRWSSAQVAPVVATTSASAALSMVSARPQTARSVVRRVPRSTAWVGITLAASPATTAPNTRKRSAGSAARARQGGRSRTTRAAASTRSTVSCGRAVWPPGPLSTISTRSAAAVNAPVRTPTWPTSSLGSQCSPYTESMPSSSPDSITSTAPPGTCSSAGSKISRTRRPSSSSDSTRPAPSTVTVWTSWPQACDTPFRVDRYDTSLSSCMASASMSPRSATRGGAEPGPTSHTRPVPLASTRGSSPAARSRSTSSWVVSNSWPLNSGWAWRCRRSATISWWWAATASRMASARTSRSEVSFTARSAFTGRSVRSRTPRATGRPRRCGRRRAR